MTLALILLAIEASLELLVVHSHLWHSKRLVAISLSGAAIIGSTALLVADFSLWSMLLAIMSIYRVINLARLIQERMNEAYLSQKFQTSSLWLSWIQLCLVLVGWLSLNNHFWLQLSAIGLVIFNAGLLYLTLLHIKDARPSRLSLALADRDLPTITVGIPARNETEDLRLCLQSLTKSDSLNWKLLCWTTAHKISARQKLFVNLLTMESVLWPARKRLPAGWLKTTPINSW